MALSSCIEVGLEGSEWESLKDNPETSKLNRKDNNRWIHTRHSRGSFMSYWKIRSEWLSYRSLQELLIDKM